MPSGIAIFELQGNITNRTGYQMETVNGEQVPILETARRQSAIAAAAYRAGENLTDHQTGEVHYYAKRSGVEHSEILAPKNAPDWVYDREELWNRHDVMERQHNSQLFREVRVALPKAFESDQSIDMTLSWVNENFVSRGMVADVAFHDMAAEDSNPHAHIMLTMRHLTEEGFGLKNREWNNYSPLLRLSKEFRDENDITFISETAKWRASWSLHVNEHLEKEGIEARISHLSKADAKKLQDEEALKQTYKDVAKWWQGEHAIAIDRAQLNAQQSKTTSALEPEHISLAAFHMEQRGIDTRAGAWLEGAEIRNSARTQAANHEIQLNEHFDVRDSHHFAEKTDEHWRDFTEAINDDWEDEYSQFVDDMEYG